MKKIKPYIINALLILLIFFSSLYLNKTSPFGNYSIGLGDAIAQYKPFLYNYITSIKNGTLESYSFIYGLGNPTYANFTYYLSSPLNLIALFFKTPESMFLSTIVLKLLLTSLTATFYFKKKTNNNFITTICTMTYIFSGWFLANHYIYVWLDTFMLFPIFQLSLERLLKTRKTHLFIITFSLCLLMNFYLAYMIGLYTIIFFVIDTFIINNKDKLKDKIYKFDIIALSTLISLLLSAAFLYFIFLSFSKQIVINNIDRYYYTKSIIEVIKNIFVGNTLVLFTNAGVTAPNICTSLLITISSLYYFLNNKIHKKEKLVSLLGIIIVLIFTFSKTADLAANLFHTPIGYTYRYSFIISFYMIFLFIRNFKTFDNKVDKKIYIIIAILFTTLLLLHKELSFEILILNLVGLICYTILLLFYNNNKLYKYLFIIVLFLELTASYTLNLNDSLIEETYSKKSNVLQYREKFNENMNYNYYYDIDTITSFTSMQNGRVLSLLKNIGAQTDTNNMMEYYGDDLYDMFLNVKNEHYLEKIFTVNKDIKNVELLSGDFANTANKIALATGGVENIIKEEKRTPTDETDESYLYKLSDKDVYAKYNDKDFGNSTVALYNEPYMILDKSYTASSEVVFYQYDEEKINELYNKLSQNQIEYTKYSDSYIEGYINVPKDEIIYTSIPYDQSWIIKVDGKKVNQIRLLNALTGIECKEGKHKITLEYKVNYEIPVLISVSTLLLLIIDYIRKTKGE